MALILDVALLFAVGVELRRPVGPSALDLADDRVRDIEDPPRRSVVLLEPHLLRPEVPYEAFYIRGLRPPPGIDALKKVADGEEILARVGEELDERELDVVRVLERIYQQIVEP